MLNVLLWTANADNVIRLAVLCTITECCTLLVCKNYKSYDIPTKAAFWKCVKLPWLPNAAWPGSIRCIVWWLFLGGLFEKLHNLQTSMLACVSFATIGGDKHRGQSLRASRHRPALSSRRNFDLSLQYLSGQRDLGGGVEKKGPAIKTAASFFFNTVSVKNGWRSTAPSLNQTEECFRPIWEEQRLWTPRCSSARGIIPIATTIKKKEKNNNVITFRLKVTIKVTAVVF